MTELETIKTIKRWAMDLFMVAQEMRENCEFWEDKRKEWNSVCNLLSNVVSKLDDIKYKIAPTELDKFIKTH